MKVGELEFPNFRSFPHSTHTHTHKHLHKRMDEHTLPDIRAHTDVMETAAVEVGGFNGKVKKKISRTYKNEKMHNTQATKSDSFYIYGKTTNRCLFEKKVVGLKMLKTLT